MLVAGGQFEVRQVDIGPTDTLPQGGLELVQRRFGEYGARLKAALETSEEYRGPFYRLHRSAFTMHHAPTAHNPARSRQQFLLVTVTGFPFWPVAVLAMLYPGIAFIRGPFRRYRRRKRNQCQSCGYNLTGNTSGVCPECGQPAPASAEAVDK